MARVLSVFFAASVQLSAANEILLASFDGAKGSTHQWRQMNDPVMGGKSTGTFSVADSKGIFSGEVVDVPFLKAPGFIKASVVDMNPFGRIFPDISTCKNIALTVKSANDYKGFRFSIGKRTCSWWKVLCIRIQVRLQRWASWSSKHSDPSLDGLY